MKKLCWNCLKYALLIVIVISSAFTIFLNHTGSSFDPTIKEIQSLRNQNRRDDAIDLITFLKDNHIYSSDEMARLERDVSYGPLEKAKTLIWEGVIKGQVNDTISGVGALAADFCLFGDLRDITRQAWNLLFDQKDFNGVIAVLSGTGIVFSTVPIFDGIYAMNKNIAKYVAKLPACMNKGMLRSFLSGRTTRNESIAIYDLLKKTDGLYPEQHPA